MVFKILHHETEFPTAGLRAEFPRRLDGGCPSIISQTEPAAALTAEGTVWPGSFSRALAPHGDDGLGPHRPPSSSAKTQVPSLIHWHLGVSNLLPLVEHPWASTGREDSPRALRDLTGTQTLFITRTQARDVCGLPLRQAMGFKTCLHTQPPRDDREPQITSLRQ